MTPQAFLAALAKLGKEPEEFMRWNGYHESSRRTLRRWLNGDTEIPQWVENLLKQMEKNR